MTSFEVQIITFMGYLKVHMDPYLQLPMNPKGYGGIMRYPS